MNEALVYIALAVGGLSIIANIVLFIIVSNQKKRLDVFFGVNESANLEKHLFEQMQKLEAHESNLSDLQALLKQLDTKFSHGFNKIGIERFNPFQETGGDQSFILVMLNEFNTGFVISSLHSRENTRVYAKEVTNGQSERKLSAEEEQLLNKVMSQQLHGNQAG